MTDREQPQPYSRAEPTLPVGGDPFEAMFADLAGPTHWPSLPPAELPGARAELTAWVELLAVRFALETRVVPPCWSRHNGMVEALSALRDHERGSYADTASPTAAVDWFRALRDVEARLADLAAKTGCSTHEHRPDLTPTWTHQQPSTTRRH